MSPERVAQRVDELIEAIRCAPSYAFAERNAAVALDYIEQLHYLNIIDAAQLQALVDAVTEATDTWRPTLDPDGLPLAG